MSSSSNPCSEICACYICNCKCNASFRRDQLVNIHTARRFEEWTASTTKKQSTCQSETAATQHTVIKDLTSKITEHASDSILKVLQHASPVKQFDWAKANQGGNHYSNPKANQGGNHYSNPSQFPRQEQLELQRAIEMSLGVTALSMAQDPFISGNIALKNELRAEMGDIPSTQLVGTQETVNQYRNKMRMGKKRKCSRSFRNDLVDLYSGSENEEECETKLVENERKIKHKEECETKLVENERKIKLKKRVMIKLLKLHKDSKDGGEKAKIKTAMKAVGGKNNENKIEMIDLIFDAHASETESFDSNDAAIHILEFVSDDDE